MLTLPIKKKWFDMILSGEKKEEYREITPYYESRLERKANLCKYGYGYYILLRNGYSKNSPTLKIGCSIEKRLKTLVETGGFELHDGETFIVCFEDGTYEHCISTYELRNCLEKDHIKRIRYIFDMADRIMIRRDVLIDLEEVEKC